MKMATQHFMGALNNGGAGLNKGVVSSALGGLLGGDDGNIEIGRQGFREPG